MHGHTPPARQRDRGFCDGADPAVFLWMTPSGLCRREGRQSTAPASRSRASERLALHFTAAAARASRSRRRAFPHGARRHGSREQCAAASLHMASCRSSASARLGWAMGAHSLGTYWPVAASAKLGAKSATLARRRSGALVEAAPIFFELAHAAAVAHLPGRAARIRGAAAFSRRALP